ncbi:hypothetical protein PR048_021801 [Dryococelus australis]|uniref:Integrase catalytic domain-containing protein n=1 Tax=Dryococelus australis TaxID=614101 RepID=A0ABQ9GZB6_9NEOP|nr:hypothetical protein PR048_021801 [Dryococelus australis]
MGDNFNTVITAIESMKQDLTMHLEEEMKRGQMCQETPSSNEVSLKITCYGCGKVDYKRRDCWHNKQRKGKTKGTVRKPFKRNEIPGGPRAHQADISFTAFSCKVMSKDNIFILDSDATNDLVVGSLEEYITLPHSVIKTANGGEMIATRAGKFVGDYGNGTISFEALIVRDLKNNLLSTSKLIQKNLTVVFSKEKMAIKGKNVSVECEKGHFNLFLLHLNPVTENTKHTITCQEFWGNYHHKIAHVNRRGLQVLNLPYSEEKCLQCLEDAREPVKTATKEGERYFQVIVDDFSHFTTVYLLKTKSEAEENLMNFIKMVKTQHGYITQYTPQQNSKAKRMNLTLMNKVRTKFAETDLPCTLWGEALNRSPTSTLQNRTPGSVWFDKNDLSKLRVFG